MDRADAIDQRGQDQPYLKINTDAPTRLQNAEREVRVSSTT